MPKHCYKVWVKKITTKIMEIYCYGGNFFDSHCNLENINIQCLIFKSPENQQNDFSDGIKTLKTDHCM